MTKPSLSVEDLILIEQLVNLVYTARDILVIQRIEQAGVARYSVNDLEKGFIWFPDIARQTAMILFKKPIAAEHARRLLRCAQNVFRKRYGIDDVGWQEIVAAGVEMALRKSPARIKQKQD